jgi:glycosyltransferase involved in cell wall biosynthesis
MTTDEHSRSQPPTIAVVIPCYRVGRRVLDVIEKIGPEVHSIYCVDDFCPDGTADLIMRESNDPRVRVLKHTANKGVGGAVRTGYRAALADKRDIVVKIDGDGQMAPALLPLIVAPILRGEADYTKGNRFYSIDRVRGMPAVRLIGNAALSFATKLSTGYWSLFDPTNGYTAIHAAVLAELPLDQISDRYFFESDMLFRLNILRAKIVDVPMTAVYGDEKSNLTIRKIIIPFLLGHLRNLFKRIVYNYFLRDFQIASVELTLGTIALLFGTIFGAYLWIANGWRGVYTQAGPVMLAALPIMAGIQLVLAFLNFDIHAEPSRAIHPALRAQRDSTGALADDLKS